MQDSKVQNFAGSQTSLKTQVPPPQTGWMKIVNQIIRPPRSKYPQTYLGPSQFVMNQTPYQRKDVNIKHKGKNISLSIFNPSQKNMWIILYLHGNSASKVESISVIRHLPKKVSLACFDFIGCGNNFEEDFVSLGIRESQQVQTVVSYLELLGYQIILWGRSMGASTALRFGKASVIVADSAFVSFKSLCKQIAKEQSPFFIPNILVSCLFPCLYRKLRNDINRLAEFDIHQLDFIQNIKALSPQKMVIFLAGNEDNLVGKHHSQQLFKQFRGKRRYLELFQGTHNSTRPKHVLQKVMNYIMEFIKQKEGDYKYSFLHIEPKTISAYSVQSND